MAYKLELKFRSVSLNKKELIAELKDLIWKLDRGVDPSGSWLKRLNNGRKSTSLKQIKWEFKDNFKEE